MGFALLQTGKRRACRAEATNESRPPWMPCYRCATDTGFAHNWQKVRRKIHVPGAAEESLVEVIEAAICLAISEIPGWRGARGRGQCFAVKVNLTASRDKSLKEGRRDEGIRRLTRGQECWFNAKPAVTSSAAGFLLGLARCVGAGPGIACTALEGG